jgi:hypothetical protein
MHFRSIVRLDRKLIAAAVFLLTTFSLTSQSYETGTIICLGMRRWYAPVARERKTAKSSPQSFENLLHVGA